MLQENYRNNAISICVEGGDGGNQRHRAHLLDGIEFPALPRILSKTTAVSRAEAGDRYRNDVLLCRRTDGGRVSAPSTEHAGAAFEQKRVGLHHFCFRACERADIDELHAFLGTLGATIIRAPREAIGKMLQQAFRFAEIRITADPPRALPLHGPCGMIAATGIEAASNAG